MAKAKPRKAKNTPITEFPTPQTDSEAPDTAVAVEDPPEEPELDPSEDPEPILPRAKPDPLPKIRDFFKTLANIPPADWGTRASVKIYRLAPIFDNLIGSKKKYIMVYMAAPAPDEEQIKRDCGSGRYRLYLNYKTAGAHKEKEVDAVEIDIFDPKFPPNLPVGDWLKEPKNRDWLWAKPILEAKAEAEAAARHPNTGSADMMGAMDMLDRIQDRAEARARSKIDNQQQGQPMWDPAEQLATVAGVAKDLAGALKATPENPIPAFISEQMTAMRTELTAQRARSDALMDRLLDNAKAPQQQNGAMSGIKELVSGIKELLPEIQGLFPKVDDAIAGRVGRSRMGGWQEFFQPVLPGLVQALAPLVPVIASRVASTGTPQPPSFTGSPRLPNMPPQQPSLPSAAPEPNLDAMLLNALGNERTGGDFADSILTLFGPLLYRQICSLGEAGMLAMLQQRPVWGQLGALQAKMPEFIHDFVTYGEEGGQDEESPAPGTNAEEPPIDLTAEVDVGEMA